MQRRKTNSRQLECWLFEQQQSEPKQNETKQNKPEANQNQFDRSGFIFDLDWLN